MEYTKYCINCGKKFIKPKSCGLPEWKNRRKFCSYQCHYEYGWETKICPICKKEFRAYKSHHKSYCSLLCRNRSRPDRGGKIILTCQICGKRFTPKARGKFGRLVRYCSNECVSKAHQGRNQWNWKGGISGNHRRETKEYLEWRQAIYQRDRWTCQDCRKKCKKGNIVAHHLKSWNKYPKLRFKIDNGITLCRICHKKRHLR